jgi:hypothetical protein
VRRFKKFKDPAFNAGVVNEFMDEALARTIYLEYTGEEDGQKVYHAVAHQTGITLESLRTQENAWVGTKKTERNDQAARDIHAAFAGQTVSRKGKVYVAGVQLRRSGAGFVRIPRWLSKEERASQRETKRRTVPRDIQIVIPKEEIAQRGIRAGDPMGVSVQKDPNGYQVIQVQQRPRRGREQVPGPVVTLMHFAHATRDRKTHSHYTGCCLRVDPDKVDLYRFYRGDQKVKPRPGGFAELPVMIQPKGLVYRAELSGAFIDNRKNLLTFSLYLIARIYHDNVFADCP